MDTGTIIGIVGIVIAAVFSVYAINDVRQQVRKLIEAQMHLAYGKLLSDLVWLFVDPRDKAHSREVAKGLQEFTALYRALDPQTELSDLKKAAEHEALQAADEMVTNGTATWKDGLDREEAQKILNEWKAQKNVVRVQKILEPKPKN